MSAPPSPAMSFQGMSMEDKVRYLTEQVAQREDTLNTMKLKTKEYVTKLKQDAQQDLEKAKETIKQEYELKLRSVQEELLSVRAAASSPLATTSNIGADLVTTDPLHHDALLHRLQEKEQELHTAKDHMDALQAKVKEVVSKYKEELRQSQERTDTLQQTIQHTEHKVQELTDALVLKAHEIETLQQANASIQTENQAQLIDAKRQLHAYEAQQQQYQQQQVTAEVATDPSEQLIAADSSTHHNKAANNNNNNKNSEATFSLVLTLQQQVEDQQHIIHALQQSIDEQQLKIQKLESVLATRQADIALLSQNIAETATNEVLTKEVQEKSQLISSLQASIDNLVTTIGELNEELADKDSSTIAVLDEWNAKVLASRADVQHMQQIVQDIEQKNTVLTQDNDKLNAQLNTLLAATRQDRDVQIELSQRADSAADALLTLQTQAQQWQDEVVHAHGHIAVLTDSVASLQKQLQEGHEAAAEKVETAQLIAAQDTELQQLRQELSEQAGQMQRLQQAWTEQQATWEAEKTDLRAKHDIAVQQVSRQQATWDVEKSTLIATQEAALKSVQEELSAQAGKVQTMQQTLAEQEANWAAEKVRMLAAQEAHIAAVLQTRADEQQAVWDVEKKQLLAAQGEPLQALQQEWAEQQASWEAEKEQLLSQHADALRTVQAQLAEQSGKVQAVQQQLAEQQAQWETERTKLIATQEDQSSWTDEKTSLLSEHEAALQALQRQLSEQNATWAALMATQAAEVNALQQQVSEQAGQLQLAQEARIQQQAAWDVEKADLLTKHEAQTVAALQSRFEQQANWDAEKKQLVSEHAAALLTVQKEQSEQAAMLQTIQQDLANQQISWEAERTQLLAAQTEQSSWVEEKALLLSSHAAAVQTLQQQHSETLQKVKHAYTTMKDHLDHAQKDLQLKEDKLLQFTEALEKAKQSHVALKAEKEDVQQELAKKEALLQANNAVAEQMYRQLLEETDLDKTTLRLALEKEKKVVEDVQQRVQQLEAALSKQEGTQQSDVIVLQTALESQQTLLVSLQSEYTQLSNLHDALVQEKAALQTQLAAKEEYVQDILSSLHSKDAEKTALSTFFEDKEKTLKQQLATLTTQSRQKVQELLQQVDNLRAEVVQMSASNSNLKQQNEVLEKEKTSLGSKYENVKSQFEIERVQQAEKKKKVKTYVDSILAENKSLSDMRTALEISFKDALAEKTLWEQRYTSLERAHQEVQETYTSEREEQGHYWQDKLDYYERELQEKTQENNELKLQVELASRTSMEEVNETRQRIEESLRELEAHKSKRLAARNEMISLAKSLEKAEMDGNQIKQSVQYHITPVIHDHVQLIETLVTNVEMVAFQLTSPSSPYAAAAPILLPSSSNGNSPGSQSTNSSGNSMNPMLLRGSQDLIDFESNHSTMHTSTNSSRGNERGGGSGKLTSISDALNMLEGLRQDVDRVNMGLIMLTMSVNKLVDIVQSNHNSSMLACCTAPFVFLDTVFNSNTLSSHSSHSTTSNLSNHSNNSTVQINRNVSGSYTTTNTSLASGTARGAAHRSSMSNTSNSNSSSSNTKRGVTLPKAPRIDSIFNRHKSAGYETVLNDSMSQHDSSYFSIEGPEEDDVEVVGFKR